MYKQIIHTFPFLSDYEVQQMRIRHQAFMKNEKWRTYRERTGVMNNKKMWSLSQRERQKSIDELDAGLDWITKNIYGVSNTELLRLNGEWQNKSYVFKYCK